MDSIKVRKTTFRNVIDTNRKRIERNCEVGDFLWNIIMDIWMVSCFAIGIFPIYQVTRGKYMTWREVGFFLFGAYLTGMPFIYLANR
jgi:hypothetical protein